MNWIKVADSNPEPHRTILMFKINSEMEIGYYVKSIDMFFKIKNSKGNNFKPTHWCYIDKPN